jgi:hypothetical protein
MSSNTPNYNFYLPEDGDGVGNSKPWGPAVNENFTIIDESLSEMVTNISHKIDDTQVVTPIKFGCVGDGVANDSIGFKEFLTYIASNHCIADGLGKIYRLVGSMDITPVVDVFLRNMKIITGTTTGAYLDQVAITFNGDVNFAFENFSIDGERDIRTDLEPWHYYTQEPAASGQYSLQPPTNVPIMITGFYAKKVDMRNVTFTNIHAQAPIIIFSRGQVNIDGFVAKGCSNDAFDIRHINVDNETVERRVVAYNHGCTNLNNAFVENNGIMKAQFSVDCTSKTSPVIGGSYVTVNRTDNFFAQGAFGLIVAGGTFNANNIVIHNYGTAGIVFDRNMVGSLTNCRVVHDDVNACSNNPSGAVWTEQIYSFTLSNVTIDILARDPREALFDSSALELYGVTADVADALPNYYGTSTHIIDNLFITTAAAAHLNKGIRISSYKGCEYKISNTVIDASNAVWALSSESNTPSVPTRYVHLNNVNISGNMRVFDCSEISLSSVKSSGTLTFNRVSQASLNNCEYADDFYYQNTTLGKLTATKCKMDKQFVLQGINGDVTLDSCKIGQDLYTMVYASNIIPRFNMTGGTIGRVTSLDAISSAMISGVETEDRMEFKNVKTYVVTGCTVKLANPNACIRAMETTPGYTVRAVIKNNCLWIKTGTAAAGYIYNGITGTLIGDASNNDEATIAWV